MIARQSSQNSESLHCFVLDPSPPMKNSTYLSLLALPSLVLFSLSSCNGPSHWVEDEGAFDVPLSELRSVACKTHNGSIKATAREQLDALKVKWKRRAGGASIEDAEDCRDAIEIVRTIDEDGCLQLGWKWLEPREINWGAAISFDIEMPGDRAMTARTHNGSVRIRGITADARAQTHNGRVEIHGCESPVKVVTHNGGIVVDGCHERVEARTHNGSIRVAGRAAHIQLQTHNGSIKADVAEASSLEGRVQTHNGNVDLSLPEDHFDLAASTRSKVIRKARSSWGNVSEDGRRHFEASSGSPRGKLRIRTHNGRIRLR